MAYPEDMRKLLEWAVEILKKIRKHEWHDFENWRSAIKSVEYALRPEKNPRLRNMMDTKGVSKSLTTWSALIVMAATVFGFAVSEPDAEMYIEKAAVIVGAVLAIVGRFRATKRIKGL